MCSPVFTVNIWAFVLLILTQFLTVSNRKCVKEWEEPHDCTLYCIQTDGNHMIASGSSYYGVVRFWDKRQSKCLQVCRVNPAGKRQKCDVVHVNAVVTSACVCWVVLPAVRPPRDQPGLLPAVQQLPPVRSPGKHAADSGLQPEPLLNDVCS